MDSSDMLISIYFSVGIISIGVLIYRFIKKKPGQKKFILMVLSSALWTISVSMDYWVPGLQAKIFWFNMQWIGILFGPAGFLLLTLQLTEDFKWKKITLTILGIIIPLLLLVMIFTNGLHHYFVKDFYLQPYIGGVVGTGWDPAPGYWLAHRYVYVLVAISLVHLVWISFRYPRIFNNQIHWLAVAAATVTAITVYERVVWEYDSVVKISPIVMCLFTLTTVFLLSRFQEQDIQQTSAEILMDAIPFPILILSQKLTIVDLNKPAEELIGAVGAAVKQKDFRVVCPDIYQQIKNEDGGDLMKDGVKRIHLSNNSLSHEASLSSVFNQLGDMQNYVLKLTPEGITGEQAEALRRSNSILLTLGQVAKEVVAHNNVEKVFNVLEKELEKLDLSYAYLTIDKAKQTSCLRHTSFDIEKIRALEKEFHQTLFNSLFLPSGWSLLSGQFIDQPTIFISDLIGASQPFYTSIPESVFLSVMEDFGITRATAAIFHLIQYQDGNLGMLCVMGKRLRQQDLLAFSIFGNQVGVAIEKAKLLQQEQQQRSELEQSSGLVAALNQVVIHSSAPTTTDALIRKIHEELQELGILFSVLTVDAQRTAAQIEFSQIEQTQEKRSASPSRDELFPSSVMSEDWPDVFKQIVEEKKPVFVPKFGEFLPASVIGIPKETLLTLFSKAQVNYDSPIIWIPQEFSDGRLLILIIWGNEIREKNLPVFAIFASQIARVFLKNSMLETEKQQSRELKRSNELLDALSQVAAKVASSSKPEMVYGTLESELEEIGLNSVFLLMGQEDDLTRGRQNHAKIVDRLVRLNMQDKCLYLDDCPPMLRAVLKNEPLYTENFRSAMAILMESITDVLSEEMQNTLNIGDDAAGFFLPLSVSGNVLGCVAIWSTDLSEKDMSILNVFISQIAISLENARLLEEERQHNEFLHQVIQSLTHPFYVVNVDDFTIEISNFQAVQGHSLYPDFCYQHVYNRDEICSKTENPCPVETVLQRNATVDIVQKHNTAENGQVIYQTHGYPIFNEEGRIQQVIVYSIDITEQEKNRIMLLRSERLASVGRLAASVAHEIKNPLQSILGCLGLVQEALEEGQDTEELFMVAYNAVTHVTTIVNQMRELYRPVDATRTRADINMLLENVFRLTQKQFIDSHVELIWLRKDIIGEIWMVNDQIHQVVLNLVLNAIDAMPQGGELRVSLIDDSQSEGIQIVIADTGYGISEEDMTNIFDPFFTTKDTGTGLGLSISHEFIRNHGGWIDVDSIIDKGTSFTMWLPKSRRKERRGE